MHYSLLLLFVAQDVGILVTDLVSLAHLVVVEGVELIVPPANGPVVPSLNRPLVHDHGQQPILLSIQGLHLVVHDGLVVLYFAIGSVFEPA